MQENKLAIYQAENGTIELNFDDSEETVWATQKQMAEVFGFTSQNITIHFENFFSCRALDKEATCKESLQVQKEGKREVKRKVQEYNLDLAKSEELDRS